MRTRKKTMSASLIAATMLLAACSGTGEGDVPSALAFQDSSTDPAPAVSDPDPDPAPAPEPDPAPTFVRPDVTCSSSDFSLAFGANVILLDPSASTFGPFDIDIPAGTYDITVATWLGPNDPNQTMEQWFFTTDSGYQSPLTTDFSPVTQQNQTFEEVELAATTQITLNHKGNTDNDNSVHPLCIGFELQEAPVVTTTTEAPVVTTTTQAPVVTTTTQAPVVTTTTQAPVVTTTTQVLTPVVTPTTEAPVEVTTTTQAPVVTTTEAPVEVTTTTVAVAATAAAAPELALTGPSDLATSLGVTGAALILAGSAAVVAARRSDDD